MENNCLVPELDGMLSTMGCCHLRRATTSFFQGRWDLLVCTVWELHPTFMHTLMNTRVLSACNVLVTKAKMCFRPFAEISSRRLEQGCPVFISHPRGSGFIWIHFMWHVWWTEWQWDAVFPRHHVSSAPYSFSFIGLRCYMAAAIDSVFKQHL
jgi:hypothetical protein